MFTSLSRNPLLGYLSGVAVSFVLQSSSATIGILQALSMTGAITFATAYPVLLGIAVGSAMPVLLSSLGAKTDGRRAALVYLILELISALVFALLYYGLNVFVPLHVADMVMDPLSLAALNSGFRILSKGLLLPCNMLRSGEQVFLDDVTTGEVETALKTKVVIVPPQGRELIRACTDFSV